MNLMRHAHPQIQLLVSGGNSHLYFPFTLSTAHGHFTVQPLLTAPGTVPSLQKCGDYGALSLLFTFHDP